MNILAEETNEKKELNEDKKETPKEIYLTIDDGPGKYMGEILETLGENKATFFIVGDQCGDEQKLSLLEKAVKSGHILGNHSFHHPSFPSISLERGKSEIKKTDDIIEGVYKKAEVERKIKLFRFPGGATKNSIIPYLNELGYKPIKVWSQEDDWNIDTEDWRYGKGRGAESIMSTCRQTKDKDVVLVHDMPNGLPFTAHTIIPYFVKSKDYKLILPS
jgi:peptidoglycan/xylan/chitin deacetylase (PgdA/CDA1 family)